jgi:hypothetical protein
MFTQQELMALLKMCDLGIRSGGLEVADIAVPLCHKIRQILQQQQQRNTPPSQSQGNVLPMNTPSE